MKKVGLIGSGRIAPFYADVLKDFDNCDISICGSIGSTSAKDLAKKFGFRYCKTAKDLIEQNDYIIIACTNKYALDYLKLCDTLGKKILVEKPLYEDNDPEYIPINKENIQVAYNRRFYKSVNKFYQLYRNHNKRLLFNINAPERTLIEGDEYFPLRSNGVHLVDLASFLIGGIKKYDVDNISTKDSLILKIYGNKHNAIINWIFNAVSNTSITLDFNSETHSLNPIERYSLFNKLKIHESIVENRNVRSYIPESSTNEEVDDRLFKYKPGFQLQLSKFLSEKHSNIPSTSLKEAYLFVQIIKSVINYLNAQD